MASWIPSDTPTTPVIPYVSPGEYRAAGTAVDTTQLVVGGNATQQVAALANRIRQASSVADQICRQVLGATSDVETRTSVLIRSDGTIRVPVKFWPVLEVAKVEIGPSPSALTTITNTADFFMQGRRVLVIPAIAAFSSEFSTSTVSPTWSHLSAGSRVYVRITYVNGWPVTTLAANAVAGATQITVASTTGFYTGRTYTIHDVAGGPEQFTIASMAGNVLTLSAGLSYAHTLPTAPDSITVSGLPDAVRAAVIELVSFLIRTRGDSAIVMAAVGGEPNHATSAEPGSILNLDTAMLLLAEFHRAAP